MKTTTHIVEGLTAFLVKVLLRPKVYYVEPPKHLHKLDDPSLLIINHTCHLEIIQAKESGKSYNKMIQWVNKHVRIWQIINIRPRIQNHL